MHKRKIKISGILLVIAVLASGIWYGRIQFVEFLIIHSLGGTGLEDIKLDISHLGLEKLHASHLSFTHRQNKLANTIEAHDIITTYRISQLFDGKVETVSIKELSLKQSHTTNTPSTDLTTTLALAPVAYLIHYKNILRNQVRTTRLSADKIYFLGDISPSLQHLTLRLASSHTDGTVSARLTLFDTRRPDAKRTVLIDRATENTLNLAFVYPDDINPGALQVNANLYETSITSDYSIDIARLKTWFEPFVNIEIPGEISPVSGKLHLVLDENSITSSSITAFSQQIKHNDTSIKKANLKLLASAELSPPYTIKILPGSEIIADEFSYSNYSISKAAFDIAVTISITEQQQYLLGTINANALSISDGTHATILNAFSTDIALADATLSANGSFIPNKAPTSVSFTARHNLLDNNGDLQLNTLDPLDLTANNHQLSMITTLWPYTFDFTNGSLSLDAQVEWSRHKPTRFTTRIHADNLGGHINELIFSGLNSQHQLSILPRINSKKAELVTLNNLDSGVTATNISAIMKLETPPTGEQPQIVINDLKGELFGGTFSSEHFVYDLNKNSNRLIITTRDIDLAEVVATQQLDDIKVTGTVDGALPIIINDQGVFIEDGALFNASRGGTIRYNPTAGSGQLSSNPLTDITLKALQDFRYSELSADVNFKPDGVLTINLQLKGRSPKLETTRPVHLNINTEQNLISLLKSLRYAEGVSAKIDAKVRQQYEQSKSQ
jgi:hypothetical protein